jgi:hypothetical protein
MIVRSRAACAFRPASALDVYRMFRRRARVVMRRHFVALAAFFVARFMPEGAVFFALHSA